VGSAAVLVFCVAPVGAAAALGGLSRLGSPADAGPPPVPSPGPGDPESATRDWMRQRITAALDRQAQALLRGDEAGFLAVAADTGTVRDDLRRQFRSLRTLRVAVWRPEIKADPVRAPGATRQWRQPVDFRYCFTTVSCTPVAVTVFGQWRDTPAGPRLVAVEPSAASVSGPRPWEVSELVTVTGARTLVATTPEFRDRLPGLLVEAERAAVVADRFAVDGSPPSRYLIFYAGRAEWARWYGGTNAEQVDGFKISLGGDPDDVVINAAVVTPADLPEVLRHELTHAASLPPGTDLGDDTWWLVEGEAEYAGTAGRELTTYTRTEEVRQLLDGGWKGPLSEVGDTTGAQPWRVSAYYGVGYLAFRRLAERYGETAALGFLKAVLHDRRSLDTASETVFGQRWDTVEADCLAYIRQVAG
jgi:hypothetical protein